MYTGVLNAKRFTTMHIDSKKLAAATNYVLYFITLFQCRRANIIEVSQIFDSTYYMFFNTIRRFCKTLTTPVDYSFIELNFRAKL